MKKIFLAALFSVMTAAMASAGFQSAPELGISGIPADQGQKKEVDVKTIYTCPMHPEIVQDKEGKCPKCGMNLVAKEVKKDVYSCPMHPEVVQDKPGKCPKCGMNLELKQPAKPSGTGK